MIMITMAALLGSAAAQRLPAADSASATIRLYFMGHCSLCAGIMRSVLVVTSKTQDLHIIQQSLDESYRVETTSDSGVLPNMLHERHFDLVFIDLDLLEAMAADVDPQTAMEPIAELYPPVEIIVMTAPGKIRRAIDYIKAGAGEYITYPIHPEEIRLVVVSSEKKVRKTLELDYLRDRFWRAETLEVIRTENAAMRDVFSKMRSVAQTKATVLLIGETGTGKGVMARLIHSHSHRRDDPFISVHCGAIPDTLLESELFGHEKGAFTGAVRRKPGKFEVARGGTIFLDEIGTLTPSSQIKLLQVLQDGTFSRVGGEEILGSNARIITASNADLQKMSADNLFRKDLYFRLNVFPIEIPPLRDRIEDIPHLAVLFLRRLNQEYGKRIDTLHPSVLKALKKYPWPGNVRELENLLERSYLLETSHVITPESFPEELFGFMEPTAVMPMNPKVALADARRQANEAFERQYLKELLSRNRGKVGVSADEAGITPRQLNKLMSKYGLRKDVFKSGAFE